MKKTTSIPHDIVILTIITLIAGVLLGLVYQITAGPIAEQQAAARAETQKAVFADAASFETVTGWEEQASAILEKAGLTESTTINSIDKALDASGNVLGYVVDMTNNEGYGGDIELMVGLNETGDTPVINAISFLELAETAGMGMRAQDPEFIDQFNGKTAAELLAYSKTGASADNEIDVISGATVTTNAVTNAVNGAILAAEYLEEG